MAMSNGHLVIGMESDSWPLNEAKDNFSRLVSAAQKGRPQTITKRGKAAVVVMNADAFERLEKGEKTPRKSFARHLLTMPRGGEDFERLDLPPRDIDL